jgi:hypothetical protein
MCQPIRRGEQAVLKSLLVNSKPFQAEQLRNSKKYNFFIGTNKKFVD